MLLAGTLVFISASLVLVLGEVCPDGSSCPDVQLCCATAANETSHEYGCCPYQDGVCCDGKNTCCPKGRTCFLGICIPIGKNSAVSGGNRQRALSDPESSTRPLVQLFPVNDQPCGATTCADYATCCFDVGCCPYANAVCCWDRQHCCPPGTTCDSTMQLCLANSPSHVDGDIASTRQAMNDNVTCPQGFTSCGDSKCCPSENAVCCSDGLHCCPQGHACDIVHGECVDETKMVQLGVQASGSMYNVRSNICPDGGYCSDDNTCCLSTSGHYGCCPFPSAVCCSDRVHCCPQNTVCDQSFQFCLRKNVISRSRGKIPAIFFNRV